jgi:N-carbamoylputrescine amidase
MFARRMAEPGKYRAAAIQMRMAPDPAVNLERALAKIAEAARNGADVVCLPELFRTPYFCQSEDSSVFDLAEAVPGPTTDAIAKAARAAGVVVIASVFERRAAGVYHNTAALIDADGSLAGVYRKMHIPDDPLYYEKYYFAPGDLGFRAFDTRVGKVGTLICWDQWYPEGARLSALSGAGILFYPTAIGWHPAEREPEGAAQYDAWLTMQRSHAIANGVYVVACTLVGHEPSPAGRGDGLDFWGGSFIADPFGRVLADAPHEAEAILIAECDPAKAELTRRHWPVLRDRRFDAYGGFTKRFLDT